MFKLYVGNQLAWLNDRRQNIAQGVENVVSAVDTRSVEDNERNNAQERTLEQITATLAGLNGKVERNIKDTNRIHENHTQMGGRMEENGKKLNMELKNSIDSVDRQCETRIGEGFSNQAMVSQSSKVEVKSEVMPREPP